MNFTKLKNRFIIIFEKKLKNLDGKKKISKKNF